MKIGARLPLKDLSNPNIRADWAYYTDSVRPLHSGLGVELVGEVSDGEKAAFLGGALALLFPIDWPEPFGLVRAEALACGTPVVAGRHGSVPESIIDGVTGLVGETDDDLVALCQRIHAIDRAPCRREATRRFSPSVMAAGYEAIYRTAIVSNQRRFTDGLMLSDGRLLDEVDGARTP